MKQQTPLRRAIDSICDLPMRYDTNKREVTISLDSVVSILTNLLPEERRVIEDAYKTGTEHEYGYCQRLIEDCSEYPCVKQCNHCKEHYATLEANLISDFFTSNFEQ